MDVAPNHPAYEAVRSTGQRGLFTGYPDGSFRGDRQTTPEEFAAALERFTQEVQRLVSCWGMRWRAPTERAPD